MSVTTDTSCDTPSEECDVLATKGTQPIGRSCGMINTVGTEKILKFIGERSAMKQETVPEVSKRKEIIRNLQTRLPMASLQVLPGSIQSVNNICVTPPAGSDVRPKR